MEGDEGGIVQLVTLGVAQAQRLRVSETEAPLHQTLIFGFKRRNRCVLIQQPNDVAWIFAISCLTLYSCLKPTAPPSLAVKLILV